MVIQYTALLPNKRPIEYTYVKRQLTDPGTSNSVHVVIARLQPATYDFCDARKQTGQGSQGDGVGREVSESGLCIWWCVWMRSYVRFVYLNLIVIGTKLSKEEKRSIFLPIKDCAGIVMSYS